MTSPPVGPAEPVGGGVHGADDEGDEQALNLVAGERDQLLRGGVPGVFVGADGSEEGVGEHGEGDSAGPGVEAADLMLVESGEPLLGLEGLLHTPP
jgi:hypothetical protein